MKSQINKVVEVLESGGIVIFPTETVFGIGCLISFEKSITRLYEIKKRDKSKPITMLVRDVTQARKYATIDETARRLSNEFWPGSLTICLPSKGIAPESILAADNTIGIRLSAHPFIQGLMEKLETPLLAPSANFQGNIPPSKSSEIDKNLKSLVDYVVDIEAGGEPPTTVISFDQHERVKIIREGKIKELDIEKVLLNKEQKSESITN